LAIRKKEILPFSTTWLDFEAITLTEISLTEKDKYCMVSLICEIKKKKKEVKIIEIVEEWLPRDGEWGEMRKGW